MGDRSLNYVEVRAWCQALDISWLDFTQNVDELLAAASGETIQGKAIDNKPLTAEMDKENN
jgi:hypothetical protein